MSILFGYVNGWFTDDVTYSTIESPWSIAVGDLNNDSLVDIIVGGSSSSNSMVSVYLQQRTGALRNELNYAVGNGSRLRYALVDHRDILTVNYGTNNIGILHGYANGIFNNQEFLPLDINSHPTTMTLGDFNDDQQMDLVIIQSNAKTIHLRLAHANDNIHFNKIYWNILHCLLQIMIWIKMVDQN